MKITILNGGHRSIELPLSDEELNFQMRQMGIRETIPKGVPGISDRQDVSVWAWNRRKPGGGCAVVS